MQVLLALLVLLLVTKVCADVAVRAGQPALVGELIGGVLIGLAVTVLPATELAVVEITESTAFESLLDLAVFFLMLVAGLEMRPKELAGATGKAAPIAIGGMLVPLAVGIGLGWLWFPESEWLFAHCLFLGVALAITAVPVAVKVLMDLDRLQTPIGQVVVASAVIDDILSLALLAVLTSVIASGEAPGAAELAGIAVRVAAFFAVAWATGRYVLPPLGRLIRRVAVTHAEFTLVIVFGLVLSVAAELLDMHFLIGAFTAGVLFTRSIVGEETYDELRRQFEAITLGFLAPVFFASIGMHLNLGAAVEIPWFTLALLGAAVIGKLVGAGAVARIRGIPGRDSLAIGAAMNARGAVEIIIADIALRAGLFDHPAPPPPVIEYLFSAVVLMAIVTTLLSPVFLRWLLK